MSKSYNLRSSDRKRGLKCYLPRISENDLAKDFSPEVRLERLKILETPEQENFRFYLEQDRIVRKQSRTKSKNKKILLLISFTVILFSLFLFYWQNELQICGFILYRNLKKFQSNMRNYYFENFDPYKHKVEEFVAAFVKKQTDEENLKYSQGDAFVKAFDEMEIKDLLRTYLAASDQKNETPKLPFSFVEDQCGVSSALTQAEESHMTMYKFYNLTYFESGNLTDYALASRGAKIASIFDTEPYGIFTIKFLNYDFGPLLNNIVLENVNSFSKKGPASVLIPWQKPGDCWAFKGTRGRIQIQLSQKVMVTAVTIDHIPRNLSPYGNVFSAPKKFSVFAIVVSNGNTTKEYLGSYEYKVEGPPIQTFSVDHKTKTPIDCVEFIIESNQGNKIYTCLYKIRVHGYV